MVLSIALRMVLRRPKSLLGRRAEWLLVGMSGDRLAGRILGCGR
jgi:hypothetical protein